MSAREFIHWAVLLEEEAGEVRGKSAPNAQLNAAKLRLAFHEHNERLKRKAS